MQKQHYQKIKRLRVFAGPNGSGKSTILNQIDTQYDIGYYINADLIEQKLKSSGRIDLSEYGISKFNDLSFGKFVKSHSITVKAENDGYTLDVKLKNGKTIITNTENLSYEAALIADFLRKTLVKNGKKITFETVMSHISKVDFLRETQQIGYKNYLYFISTESPLINIERVKQRVELGGHFVPETKIKSRYFSSLKLLKEAVKYTHRTFVFDNSEKEPKLILEIYKGEEVFYKYPEIPKWVDEYLLL